MTTKVELINRGPNTVNVNGERLLGPNETAEFEVYQGKDVLVTETPVEKLSPDTDAADKVLATQLLEVGSHSAEENASGNV